MSTARFPRSSSSIKKVTTTIFDQLTWGLTYRNQNANKREIPLQPACSPINVQEYSVDKIIKKVSIQQTPKKQQSKVKNKGIRKEKCVYTTNLHAGAVDLLGRSMLNQKQYMKVLAVPNRRCFNKPMKKKRKHGYFKDHCSPRILKLALPRKTHVLATWKDHEYFLSSECILRLHDLLHSANNVDLKDVRFYFKKYDKKKRKLMRILKKSKKRHKELLNMMWIQYEVKEMARAIINYFLDEPKLDLSFKQLLMSSVIIDYIRMAGKVKRPISRNDSKPFRRTLIEIGDKLAVWMDSVMKLVDSQPIDDEDEFYSGSPEEYEGQEEEYNDMEEDYINISLEQIDEEEEL